MREMFSSASIPRNLVENRQSDQVPISSKNFQKYWLQGQNISFDFV